MIADFLEGFVGGAAVELVDGEGFFLVAAAEGHVGDIDLVFAEDGAQHADDAGYVAVAQDEEEADGRDLDTVAKEADEARVLRSANERAGNDEVFAARIGGGELD